jgi:dTDP-4-amino-4,6-dideoxygalactose transaminase
MEKLDDFIRERQRWAEYYIEELRDIPWLNTPRPPEAGQHAWQSFVTRVDPQSAPASRNQIMEKLQTSGISTRPGTHAVHMLSYYRDRFGFLPGDYPGAHDADQNSMAIPLHNRMTYDDYSYVVETMKNL